LADRKSGTHRLSRCILASDRITEAREKSLARGLHRHAPVRGDDFGAQRLEGGDLLHRIVVTSSRLARALEQRDLPAFRSRAAARLRFCRWGLFGSGALCRRLRDYGGERRKEADAAAERVGEVGRGRVSVAGEFRHALEAYAFQLQGKIGPDLSKRLRFVFANLPEYLGAVASTKRRSSTKDRVQRRRETVDVGSTVRSVRSATRLFRRHIRRRARHDSKLRRRIHVRKRDTEIYQHGPLTVGKDDIGWLDVAMNDALRVRVRERIGDGCSNLNRFDGSGAVIVEPLGKARTGEKFGNDEAELPMNNDIEDRDNTNMSQLRERPSFAKKSIGIGRSGPRNFDRYAAVQSSIESAIDRSITALTELFAQFVAVAKRDRKCRGNSEFGRTCSANSSGSGRIRSRVFTRWLIVASVSGVGVRRTGLRR